MPLPTWLLTVILLTPAITPIAMAQGQVAPLRPEFVTVPAGVFTMGAGPNEAPELAFLERPSFRVRITRDISMQTTHVTQYQWFAVMGGNPSVFVSRDVCACAFTVENGVPLCVNNPVENITWDEAQAFVDALNGDRSTPVAWHELYPSGFFYELPSEAEFERAARGGTSTSYWFGDDPAGLTATDWVRVNADGRTHGVGSKQRPNPYGLHDVHGNVWQWLRGFHQPRYPLAATDPLPLIGEVHPMRGCSYGNEARSCRSAYRNFGDVPGAGPEGKGSHIGLRVSRTPLTGL